MANTQSHSVPTIRFPEFRNAPVWKAKILGNQGTFLSSLTGKAAKDFDTGEAVFIPYMNVFSNAFANATDLRSVDVADGESQNAVAKGDVFFTVSSETPEEAGMSSVLLENIDNCYLNSFCALFRFDEGKSPNSVFLGYLLRSAPVREHLSRGAQGATRYNISRATFRSLPILIPSGPEQQKIADCLGSLDDLIAAEGRKLESLRQHKQGLMQRLFPQPGETVPRLRFPEFRNTADWKIKTLGTQGRFLSSLTGKAANDFDTGHASFIPYMNVFSNAFTDATVLRSVNVAANESQNAVAKGDVFFTVSSETPEDAGMSSVLLEDIESCYLNSFCALFRFDEGKSPDPVFLGYLLRSATAREHLSRGAQGATRYNISRPTFRSLPVLIPSELEQRKIADCLGPLDDLIAAECGRVESLRQHRQGLMQQLFPNLEVESR